MRLTGIISPRPQTDTDIWLHHFPKRKCIISWAIHTPGMKRYHQLVVYCVQCSASRSFSKTVLHSRDITDWWRASTSHRSIIPVYRASRAHQLRAQAAEPLAQTLPPSPLRIHNPIHISIPTPDVLLARWEIVLIRRWTQKQKAGPPRRRDHPKQR